jgi:hypothetical protein
LSGIKAFRGVARLKESVVCTTDIRRRWKRAVAFEHRHHDVGGQLLLLVVNVTSGKGPRWSTSCRGQDAAFEDAAGRHDIGVKVSAFEPVNVSPTPARAGLV